MTRTLSTCFHFQIQRLLRPQFHRRNIPCTCIFQAALSS